MSGWIIRWVFNMVALILTAWILPGFSLTIWGAMVGCAFLGIVNAWIRPVLWLIPFRNKFNWLVLMVATIIANCFGLWLTSATIKGFDIAGIGTMLLAVLVASFFSILISFAVRKTFYGKAR